MSQPPKPPVPDVAGSVPCYAGVASPPAERRQAAAPAVLQQLQTMLLDQVRDAVTVTDLEGRVLYWNEAASRLYGFSAEEMVGQPLVCRFPPQVQAEVEQVLRQIAAGADWSGEYEDYRKDGLRVWVDLRISRIADAQGRPVGILGLARDVSQRRLLQAQLWQAQKMEAVGQLAGGIAHDFNNLLTIINGYSDMVLEALPPREPLRELVAEIKTAGERSAVLTRQLLAFSRKQVLAPQRIDLNQVVRDAEKLLRRAVGESVSVVLHLSDGLPAIKADPGQIEQVLLNLAVNARDAMPHGGELVVATEALAGSPDAQGQPPSTVLLSVRDTGCGMSEEVQRHIFEPFFTTKGPGKGTGLGLAVVHGIVQQSGGWIQVHSTPGLGTTFRIGFPASAAAAQPQAPERTTVDREEAIGTETILVVEDEAAVRRMSAGALGKRGYHVLTAEGPAQAVSVCQNHTGTIHLLLTDLVMPELNGRRLAELLRAQRPEMKVLYMSGYPDDAAIRKEVVEAGLPFLSKPFSPSLLCRKVRQVLDTPPASASGRNTCVDAPRECSPSLEDAAL